MKAAYLSQLAETLAANISALNYFNYFQRFAKMKHAEARTFLHRFQFSGDQVFNKIGDLSMGEKTKLILASFMAQEPDVLILDEPTNHLDLESIEVLKWPSKNFAAP